MNLNVKCHLLHLFCFTAPTTKMHRHVIQSTQINDINCALILIQYINFGLKIMVRKQSWHLFVCLRVSRCRAALFLYGLHGTLQRHLKREQLAGRLPQHKACHKLPQHGRALILLQRERDGNMLSKKQSVSLSSCLQTASSTMMM